MDSQESAAELRRKYARKMREKEVADAGGGKARCLRGVAGSAAARCGGKPAAAQAAAAAPLPPRRTSATSPPGPSLRPQGPPPMYDEMRISS